MTTATKTLSLSAQLGRLGACDPARGWVRRGKFESAQAAWEACKKPYWMAWYLDNVTSQEPLDTTQAVKTVLFLIDVIRDECPNLVIPPHTAILLQSVRDTVRTGIRLPYYLDNLDQEERDYEGKGYEDGYSTAHLIALTRRAGRALLVQSPGIAWYGVFFIEAGSVAYAEKHKRTPDSVHRARGLLICNALRHAFPTVPLARSTRAALGL